MKDFDWNILYHFYLVSKNGSISKASEKNKIPMSTLSNNVKRLEKFMGVKLFHRSHGMRFTPEGENAFSHAKKHFESLPDLKKLAHFGQESLCVVTTLGFGHFYLSDLVKPFRESYPNVSLEIFVHPDDHDIDRRGADIAISKPLPGRDDLEQIYLYTGECNLYVSQEYIHKKGRPQTVNELVSHEVIGFTTNPIGYVDWFLKDMDTNFTPPLIYNSSPEILKLVLAGVGMGGIDRKCIPEGANVVKVFPDMPDFYTHFYVLYKKRSPKLDRIQGFVKFLREVGNFYETCPPINP